MGRAGRPAPCRSRGGAGPILLTCSGSRGRAGRWVEARGGLGSSDTRPAPLPSLAAGFICQQVWAEERLSEANEKGTLVVLENLDSSFTSAEVEDIIWHVFKQMVKAKMLPRTAFSSPHSGQALVIFKTKEAADNVILQLTHRCLVLGDGRPIVGRRRLPRKLGGFFGHLCVDRTRPQRQREEIRNAVATSHFSQGNTIEFEMAIHWRALQEKSDLWWRALHEEQGNEIEALMKQMKIHHQE